MEDSNQETVTGLTVKIENIQKQMFFHDFDFLDQRFVVSYFLKGRQ